MTELCIASLPITETAWTKSWAHGHCHAGLKTDVLNVCPCKLTSAFSPSDYAGMIAQG